MNPEEMAQIVSQLELHQLVVDLRQALEKNLIDIKIAIEVNEKEKLVTTIIYERENGFKYRDVQTVSYISFLLTKLSLNPGRVYARHLVMNYAYNCFLREL